MNRHQNARTTPWGRALMVRRVREQGWTAARAAAAAGVSLRTVRKWLARHRAEGEAGLLDRSSRPRSSTPSIGAGWREVIVRLRRCRMTADEIARHLGLARSTVAAELRRLGLNRLAALEPKAPVRRGACPRAAWRPTRGKRARPGDLIHLDVKKLARFDKPGHRVTGTRRGQNAGVGWEFVHVCIDDHARLAGACPRAGRAGPVGGSLDDETGEVCARFLARAVGLGSPATASACAGS